jgi:hypothetical protein
LYFVHTVTRKLSVSLCVFVPLHEASAADIIYLRKRSVHATMVRFQPTGCTLAGRLQEPARGDPCRRVLIESGADDGFTQIAANGAFTGANDMGAVHCLNGKVPFVPQYLLCCLCSGWPAWTPSAGSYR